MERAHGFFVSDPYAILLWVTSLFAIRYGVAFFLSPLLGASARGIALPFFLLIWSYFYWLWGSALGLPDLLVASLVSLIPLGLLLWRLFSVQDKPKKGRLNLTEEGLFWVVFTFGLVLRMRIAAWSDAEKFSDLAVFQAVLLGNQFPPVDRWLAGLELNYYYFGPLFFVPILQVLAIPIEQAVNLIVPTIAAMGASVAYSLVFQLGSSRRVAFLSASACMLFSNWYWIGEVFSPGKGIVYWWNSSRAIPGTITEFPFFSLLLGDFHPHFTAIPWMMLTIVLAALTPRIFKTSSSRSFRALWLMILSCSVGVHYPLNSWGLPVMALITCFVLWPRKKSILFVGLASFFLFFPFWLSFERPVSGMGLVSDENRSPFWPFFLHWAPLLAPMLCLAVHRLYVLRSQWKWIFLLLLLSIGFGFILGSVFGFLVLLVGVVFELIRKEREEKPFWYLWITAVFLILFCEVIYFQDGYGPENERVNTVFKFYIIAWCLLACSVPYIVWAYAKKEFYSKNRFFWTGSLVAFVIASLFYTVLGTRSRVESAPAYFSLDGMVFWEKRLPGEREIVDWIRQNAHPNAVIWEATGKPYSMYSRISTFSGRPSVLGWANHEWVYRPDGREITGNRQRDIDELIRAPSAEKLTRFLKHYQVRFIVLGRLERSEYSGYLVELISRFPVVKKTLTTSLYRVPEDVSPKDLETTTTIRKGEPRVVQ